MKSVDKKKYKCYNIRVIKINKEREILKMNKQESLDLILELYKELNQYEKEIPTGNVVDFAIEYLKNPITKLMNDNEIAYFLVKKIKEDLKMTFFDILENDNTTIMNLIKK